MAEKYMGNWGYKPPCWSFFNGKTHNQLQRWKIDARPGQRGESHAAAAVPRAKVLVEVNVRDGSDMGPL